MENKFSFVIAFKDREIDRIKFCLQSLAKQTLQNFELVFVDYGSTQAISAQAALEVNKYSFARYIYAATTGMLWNRSHALNIGIRNASHEYIITGDIDLVYAPNFVEHINTLVARNKAINYRCYYLPPDITDATPLNNLGYKEKTERFRVSGNTGMGLLVVSKESITKVCGYDEYFKIWGVEDINVNDKLMKLGLAHEWVNIETCATYHIWHPASSSSLPTFWYQRMWDYHEKGKPHLNINFGENILVEDRMTYALYVSGNYAKECRRVEMKQPISYYINNLYEQFNTLNSGDCLYIEVENIYFVSKMGSTIDKINQLFKKIGFNYRLVNKHLFASEYIVFNDAIDMIMNFLLLNYAHLQDYYLYQGNDKIMLIFQKK